MKKGKLKKLLRDAYTEGGRYYIKGHIPHNIGKPKSFDEWYNDNVVNNLAIHNVINWVAVDDELPSHQTDVITYSKEFEVRNGRCMQKSTWFVNGYSKRVDVTHWAELPKPPCL